MPAFTPYADKPAVRLVAVGELHGRIFFSAAAQHAPQGPAFTQAPIAPSLSTWAGPPLFPKPALPSLACPPLAVKRLPGSFTVAP